MFGKVNYSLITNYPAVTDTSDIDASFSTTAAPFDREETPCFALSSRLPAQTPGLQTLGPGTPGPQTPSGS